MSNFSRCQVKFVERIFKNYLPKINNNVIKDSKNTNTYTIDRENFEKLNKDTREFIKKLLNIKEK